MEKIQYARKGPTLQPQVNSEEEYDDAWPTRMPSSARRYHSDVKAEVGRVQADVQTTSTLTSHFLQSTGRKSTVPPRRTATQGQGQRQTQEIPAIRGARRVVNTENIQSNPTTQSSPQALRMHWLVYVGVSMLVMVLGWSLLSMAFSWWQITLDDWRYGRPRTMQTNYVVGHNDSTSNPSHFIAVNLQRHIEIIEFPGGDATKARVYIGPVLMGQGQDLAVVTLDFKDVNGDNTPDMLVTIQDSRLVFINEKGSFRPARSDENIHIP